MGRRSGTSEVQQQPTKIHKDDAGITTTIGYETTDRTKLEPSITLLDGSQIPYDYVASFGKARLDVSYPYDFATTPQSYVNSLWEFFAQKVEKDLLTVNLPVGNDAQYDLNGNMTFAGSFPSFGNFISAIGTIQQNDAFLIRTAQQQSQQGFVIGLGWFGAPVDVNGVPLQYTPVAGQPPVNVPPALNPYGCFNLLTLILRGNTAAPVFAPTLRFTQTVTSEYAIQASLLNAGNIISTLSMPLLENIPNGLLFSLPNNFNPPTQWLNVRGDLVWGWFKDFPTIRQIAKLKWNIVQEWQYGLYPVAVYGELL